MSDEVVHVKVFPGSKKEKLIAHTDGSFELYVREPATHNLANQRTRECLATHYKVPVGQVQLHTGHRARKKTLRITQ